ncbi:MAG: hypothetical protein GX488_04675 [Clostridiales bacterium]|nr:hypothetical protein [Clostridiales bacterium]
MAQVLKGKITQVIGNAAVIRPFGFGAALTPPLPAQSIEVKFPSISGTDHTHPAQTVTVIHPTLAVGNDVVFALFEDGTGIIIAEG